MLLSTVTILKYRCLIAFNVSAHYLAIAQFKSRREILLDSIYFGRHVTLVAHI